MSLNNQHFWKFRPNLKCCKSKWFSPWNSYHYFFYATQRGKILYLSVAYFLYKKYYKLKDKFSMFHYISTFSKQYACNFYTWTFLGRSAKFV